MHVKPRGGHHVQGLRSLSIVSLYCSQFTYEDFLWAKLKLGSIWQISDLAELFCDKPKLHSELRKSWWHSRLETCLKWCDERQVEILYPSHPWYPPSLLGLDQPPLFLSLLGKPAWTDKRCLAVVGSRNPTTSSLRWMESELTPLIRDLKLITVSGGARGVDQKCHMISLRAQLPTVVLLPSGLQNVYPRELVNWTQHVVESGGCFLSQFAPEMVMYKHHFRARNRLIAQMGDALLVVEAARRSGSIMTAHLAMEREKPVCVLPGHPTETNALGVLDLLFDGASPIRDQQDLRLLWN